MLRVRKKEAALLAALLLGAAFVLFGRGPKPPALPRPCYNHGPEACVSITDDPKMRAYTGMAQVAEGHPGQCEQRRFGHAGDGGWYACVDPRDAGPPGAVRFLGQQPGSRCLVYSFGIRDDWTFDVAMRDAGCEVHSFDPTIGQPKRCRYGSDLQPHGCQPSGIEFHPIGLGSKDGERLQVDEDSTKHGGAGELKTLSTIRKELGHAGRQLTVLKFDIEGSEWPVLSQIAANRVDKTAQILTEIHYWGAGCDTAQAKWYERRRKRDLDEANVPADQWYNVCREQPPSVAEMASYHDTIEAMVASGYVFSRIDVNHWSTIMQGLVAGEGGTMVDSVKDRDVQCCYEAIITNLGDR